MKYKYLMFDLDGTLIDSFPTIIEAYQCALDFKYKTREQDVDKLKRLIGLPLKDFFTAYPEEDRQELQTLFAKFNDEFQHKGVPYFAGVKEALVKAKEKGAKLSLVTSKRRKAVEHWLAVMNEDLFYPLIAKEDTERNKPYGDPILKAMEIVNAKPNDVLYVGDTVHDIRCAHNAGVDCAVVGWTASNFSEINQYKPEYIINNPDELLDLI